jgi:hypothetical protein
MYLAGSKDVGGQYQMMIWKSSDCGETWPTLIPVGDPAQYKYTRFFEISKSDPSIWYIGGYEYTGSGYVPAIYRSNDGGATWFDAVGDLPTYGYDLWLDTVDPDHLIIAGYNMGYMSTNGGVNWTAIPDLGTQYILDGMMLSNPVTGVLYSATYYNGVITSTDGGMTWRELNYGLNSSTVRGLAIDVREGWLYAATYGAGINRLDIEAAPLWAQYGEFRQATGSTIDFAIDAGVANADREYLIVGGVSGSVPGTALPGGMATLPVHWDEFSRWMLTQVNLGVFVDFYGTLDGDGQADAQLVSGPVPAIALGATMTYAYCCNKPFDYVSNPIDIIIN